MSNEEYYAGCALNGLIAAGMRSTSEDWVIIAEAARIGEKMAEEMGRRAKEKHENAVDFPAAYRCDDCVHLGPGRFCMNPEMGASLGGARSMPEGDGCRLCKRRG